MQIEYKPTEPRNTNINSIRSNRFKSFINNNKILKVLRDAAHPVEIIPPNEWRKKTA